VAAPVHPPAEVLCAGHGRSAGLNAAELSVGCTGTASTWSRARGAVPAAPHTLGALLLAGRTGSAGVEVQLPELVGCRFVVNSTARGASSRVGHR